MLVVARLLYAGLTGGALALTTLVGGDRESIGQYVYYVGGASAIATVLSLGADRVLARRVSSGMLAVGIPRHFLAFRAVLFGVVGLLTLGFAVMNPDFLPWQAAVCIGMFVVSRVAYVDYESLWIASGLSDRRLAVALSANGVLTASSVVLGAYLGWSAIMVAGSALGNVVALLVLASSLRIRPVAVATPLLVRESRGIAGSLFLSVIYARVDLLILAFAGADLTDVAIYGVIVRVFDALLIVRGSLAQQETRDIARLKFRDRVLHVFRSSIRYQLALGGVSAISIVCVVVARSVLSSSAQELDLAVLALAAVPLFFSHMPSSALIFADDRTHLLLFGSILSCLISVGVKLWLVSQFQVSGAVLAICIMEWVSTVLFLMLYSRSEWSKEVILMITIPVSMYSLLAGLGFGLSVILEA